MSTLLIMSRVDNSSQDNSSLSIFFAWKTLRKTILRLVNFSRIQFFERHSRGQFFADKSGHGKSSSFAKRLNINIKKLIV